MRLFEAIMDANHRAVAGDSRAGVHPTDFPDGLPIVALTCIDPRLNRLLPEVLGVHEDDFIWLRNAGNIVFEPLSSMVRSIALACAVKGGKEIAIVGHTDCRVRQLSINQLIETFRALGIDRKHLPDDLMTFFGLFASERQNVINGVAHVRQSPLISARVPVHGLIVEVETGRLEWLVNGYDQLGTPTVGSSALAQKFEQAREVIGKLAEFRSGDLKFPEIKIGDMSFDTQKWLADLQVIADKSQHAKPPSAAHPPAPAPSAPPPLHESHSIPSPPIPIPPPIRPERNILKPKR
jgi:carbonic anhydrase